MALIDDIIGMIIIVLLIIIATILVINKVVVRESSNIEQKNEEFLHDYYSIALDTFLHFNENTTGKPFNVLLGDYVYTGKRVFSSPNGTVDIKKSTKDVLDIIFGSGNYYMKITPKISNFFISFVFDGSDSLQDEREEIAGGFNKFVKNINTMLNSSETKININVYILSEKDQKTVCGIFPKTINIRCEAVPFNKLYSIKSLDINPPSFGYSDYNEWRTTQPTPYAQDSYFSDGDWMAGIMFAAEQYLNQLKNISAASAGGSLHIIIPISDELSTSSIADDCFNIKANAEYPAVDYTACALCDDKCPVERSSRYIENITQILKEINNIVIPVFSFQCSFPYNPLWNKMTQTEFNSQYIDFPIESNICEEPNCGGCKAGADYDSFCFHTSCHDEIRDEMNFLANATGGDLVDITDVKELSDQIISRINNFMSRLKIEVGVLDEERTRYVFERNILLPSYGLTKLFTRVYETPFIDKQPPEIVNVTVNPWMGHNGTIFKINALVNDNSSLSEVKAEILTPKNEKIMLELTPSILEDKYYGEFNSTRYAEGDYYVSLMAVDSFNNTAEKDNATSFRINDTDIIPPEVLSISATPSSAKLNENITISVDAEDNLGIKSAKVIVKKPSGQNTTLNMREENKEETTYKFETNFVDTDEVGKYLITAIVEDFGANKGSKDGESFHIKPDECAPDTICTAPWPGHQGETIKINENMYSCDAVEVCSSELDFVVEEVISCCEDNDCSGGKCNANLCRMSRQASGVDSTPSDTNTLKCKELYVINGLGGAAQFKMHGYFANEVCCSGQPYCTQIHCSQTDMNQCSCSAFNIQAPTGFECVPPPFRNNPLGWGSDTDMSENSCKFSDLPPHASVNYIQSGTCADYSLALVTLLRKIGAGANDAFSITGPGHAFNLIKFPGETRWNIIDTTANNPTAYNPNGLPGTSYPNYCSFSNCLNDNGRQSCPPKNTVKGCH